ncbi:MAG: hypothetical protein EOM15_16310 [Spirochaetia bacterium]|nr:hypothetical protein [Spirochaetia bacterium]
MKLDNIDDAKRVVRFSLVFFIYSIAMVIAAVWMINGTIGNIGLLPLTLIAASVAFQGATPFLLITEHKLKLKDLKAEKKPVE